MPTGELTSHLKNGFRPELGSGYAGSGAGRSSAGGALGFGLATAAAAGRVFGAKFSSVVNCLPALVLTLPAGRALAGKLTLVALAAALGGFNRFRVLPSLFVSLRAGGGGEVKAPWPHRLKIVLRVEAVVLCLVLVAAAVLAGTEPPGQ